jgi:membrane fusion protein (multidrug efflux system)
MTKPDAADPVQTEGAKSAHPPVHAHSAKQDLPWWRQPNAVRASQGILAAAVLGLLYWLVWVHPYVSTDDARIAATLVHVAPEGVSGKVIAVHVTEGDFVKAGQVLVELDPEPAKAQLQKASARALEARNELKRAEALAAQRGISAHQLDQARAASGIADADERMAQLALDHCTLTSPFDAVVIQKLAEVGNQLEAGQNAVTVADLDNAWVAANVEEDQAGRLKAGQKVKIEVDEGGDLEGQVLEVRQATLSTFSLLPTENASGNFVKLVQRIPVKIALAPHPGRRLRVGQSVEVRVRVR